MRIYLSLGSNLGDRLGSLSLALKAIDGIDGISVIAVSSIYETKPQGFVAQPDFLNLAVLVESALSPLELMKQTQAIETKLGKKKLFLNGPRAIDIDLLFAVGSVSNTPVLTLPHPRMLERAFVLIPLAEIWREPAPLPPMPKEIEQQGCVRVFDPITIT